MRLIIALFSLLLPFMVLATESITRFDRLSIKDGLSQSGVLSIVQDSKGFLWFATQDGLNRYDGFTFKVFRHYPQNPGSISNNHINTLYKDSKDQLWIGTRGGLNRFDTNTERFVYFKHQPSDPHSLSHDNVMSISQDNKGHLWIGTYGGGLNKFDSSTAKFTHFKHDKTNANSLSHDNIFAVHQDKKGILWLGTERGLNRFDPEQQRFSHYQHNATDPHSLSHNRVYAIHEDNNGQLWLGTHHGLNRYNGKQFDRFTHHPDDPNSVSHNQIKSLFEDSRGTLWIGTAGGGLNRYDAQHQHFIHFKHQTTDPFSLNNNLVESIYEDNQGAIWIGTYGGLNRIDSQREYFGHVKHQAANPNSLSDNNVQSLYKDSKGILWIGTDQGLNRYDPQSQQFTLFNHNPVDLNSLSHNPVVSISEGSQGYLWVATLGGGLNRYNPEQQNFTRFKHQTSNPQSLSSDAIFNIFNDSKGSLWLGTMGGGLNETSNANNTSNISNISEATANQRQFNRYQHQKGNAQSLSNNNVSTIFEDSKGALWVGTFGGGLNHFNIPAQRFTSYQNQPADPHSLSHNIVVAIHEDSNGILWIGTHGGLNKFNREDKNFTHYRKTDGLANDTVLGILEDQQQQLWLSTNMGLSHFNPTTETFRNFDSDDGLQSNEFNHGAYFQSADGKLYFGGINGFNHFYPHNIKNDSQPPVVILTDFLLANQSVPITALTPSPVDAQTQFTLAQSIDALEHLTLGYQQNLISFEFAALHFANPMKNQYAYKLEGQDKDWVVTGAKKRWATYSNLSPGHYTLRIKASNHHGYWNEQGKSLKITILPPPWRSWWAYSIYLTSIISLLLLGLFIFSQQRKLHARDKEIYDEHALNLRLTEVDKLKDEFLANTSHELRTPLNGIIGLAESLIDGATGPLPEKTTANLAMVVASGRRLSNLVNDILDFSKLKNRNLSLTPRPVDLYSMVDVVLTLSQPLLNDKKQTLELVNAVDPKLPAVLADEDRLQQIFHNLVGNAIKFTKSGKVTVSAKACDDRLTISVTDTGIGIATEHFDDIFESFEQLAGHSKRPHSGTGLGLAVSKQLVELHGGTLGVTSRLGQGAIFSFSLAIAAGIAKANNSASQTISRLHMLATDDAEVFHPQPSHESEPDSRQFRILLVDDEPINRQVLHNHLSLHNYQLVEASGGEQALSTIANEAHFDLVLLDIMMPGMSGYEVCQKIRENHLACDLPVIFLTAKNQVADLVQSFAVGGNDYLSKPVSKHELLTRVKTHLQFLDIHRNLEAKVTERTTQLEQKNQQIKAKNQEVKQKNQQLEQKNSEIIATQQQLLQSETMASLGTLTAGVAHEINNPTNFVHVSSQNLEADLDRFKDFLFQLAGEDAEEEVLANFASQFEQLYGHLGTIQDGTQRIKVIVEDLRAFTQLDSAEQKTVKITDLLQSTVNLVQTQYLETTQFTTDFEVKPQIFCYPAQLNQVFMNIIVNACHSIAEKRQQQSPQEQVEAQIQKKVPGQIIINCRWLEQEQTGGKEGKNHRMVEIAITDNGCGMSDETQNKLFEPFYTTKEVGHGTGLGLSISYGIVKKHGGELCVESELGRGSTILLRLPE
ncbi:MAG: signal transduction histidine kinase/ligand-binding sensor domain-containing protein [Phenylobacterium sp.]|jgi:signal transduction histidine kinase/ligand-binding sensor domain-containing protein